MKKPVALIILDGWGVSENCENNAVCQAHTPRLDELAESYPTSSLKASGLNVGLPDGQMGNSEVGHLNIGAGRIIYQDLTRISRSIKEGDFFTNPTLLDALVRIRNAGGKLHLMGLLSDGGVHSHNTHLYALIDLAKSEGVEVCVHAFMDGRDTPPQSGAGYLEQLEEEMIRLGHGRLATVIGRYYAMDRDNRWDRVKLAWQAMAMGQGQPADSSAAAIQSAYKIGQTDEFVEPRVIQQDGLPIGCINDHDGIIFFNFRADRAREITRTFTEPGFAEFERPEVPELSVFACLTEYDETFGLPVAYASESYPRILGEVVADASLHQLRIAETEKYAHVTFFFNGGVESPFANEDRALIPSPKEVATYDLKPVMSAPEVTDEVIRDMVGHTGVLSAAISAMETVDSCAGRVVDALLEVGGCALITADHGNCEMMVDNNGTPHTAHTTNRVPLVLVDVDNRQADLQPGILADIAPTILGLMGLAVPAEMTGKNLIS
jgi:2,3-bisphosphoglycerate-independent phosphoglycerate mutase